MPRAFCLSNNICLINGLLSKIKNKILSVTFGNILYPLVARPPNALIPLSTIICCLNKKPNSEISLYK